MPSVSVHHRFYLKLRSRKHALEGTVWIRCFFDWLKAYFRVHLMDIKSCLELRWGIYLFIWFIWKAYLQICPQVFLIDIEYLLLHLLKCFWGWRQLQGGPETFGCHDFGQMHAPAPGFWYGLLFPDGSANLLLLPLAPLALVSLRWLSLGFCSRHWLWDKCGCAPWADDEADSWVI